MADTEQILQEFTQNLLSDLQSGLLTVDEAIAACNQYAYLRESIAAKKDVFSRASLIGEDELKKIFTETIEETLGSLSELPGFQGQSPDFPTDETTVRNIGAVRKVASDRIRDTIKPTSTDDREARRGFIHELVTRYSARNGSVTDRSMERAVDQAMAQAAGGATSAQTKERFAEQLVASIEATGSTIPPEEKAGILTEIKSVISGHTGYFTENIQREKRALAMYETLIENPDLKRPDVFADVALNAPLSEDINETLTRSLKLARVADSLEEHGGRGGRLRFFTTDGTKGVMKGIQQGADGILSIVGDPVRDMVYHQKVSGLFQSMLRDTQKFVDRLGEGFVKSSLFTRIGQDLTKQLSERQPSGAARGVVNDVFSSIFRGPLGAPLNAGVEDRILDYFELARANAISPEGRKFLPSGLLPWDAFRIPASRIQSTNTTTTSIRASSLPFLPFIGLGTVGRIAGDFVSTIVDKTTSFALTSPLLPRQISGSRRAAAIPIPFWQDMPLLIATLVIATIMLLFVLPGPTNLSSLSHSSKVVSLLTGLVPSTEEPSATTNDNGWPVKCGCIVNGPGQTSHSTNNLNAIDFAFGKCKPAEHVGLYAVAKGTVSLVSQQFGVGETCFSREACGGRSTYGNYIEITITEGAAKGLTLLYAHMATIRVHEGQTVQKGELVGTSNHNGYSSQEHLHFEVLGGPSHPPLDKPNPVTPQAGVNGFCL